MFYAAFNNRADIKNGNRGFLNTWEIVQFETKSARNDFVVKEENRAAKPVTRKQASNIFAGNFLSVGQDVPKGGLFGNSVSGSHFYSA